MPEQDQPERARRDAVDAAVDQVLDDPGADDQRRAERRRVQQREAQHGARCARRPAPAAAPAAPRAWPCTSGGRSTAAASSESAAQTRKLARPAGPASLSSEPGLEQTLKPGVATPPEDAERGRSPTRLAPSRPAAKAAPVPMPTTARASTSPTSTGRERRRHVCERGQQQRRPGNGHGSARLDGAGGRQLRRGVREQQRGGDDADRRQRRPQGGGQVFGDGTRRAEVPADRCAHGGDAQRRARQRHRASIGGAPGRW